MPVIPIVLQRRVCAGVPRGILLAALTLATVPFTRAGVLSFLFGDEKDIEVITDSDVYAKPGAVPAANREAPVYYRPVSVGYIDFAAAVAGEKLPQVDQVRAAIEDTLATQGYKPATAEHPATMLLLFGWGTLHPTRLGPDFGNLGATQVGGIYGNYAFLGGNKIYPYYRVNALPFIPPEVSAFMDRTVESHYVIKLSAYDIQAVNAGRASPLWTTKIFSPARGHYLPEVIPTMLALGGPHIGRQTKKPLVVRAGDQYKTDVRIGPTRVLEEDVSLSAEHERARRR